jgi:hypothetical protein
MIGKDSSDLCGRRALVSSGNRIDHRLFRCIPTQQLFRVDP